MSPHAALTHILKSNGLSMTIARTTVYAVLAQSEPLTMAELVKRCVPVIDRASVYRTVTIYEKLGVTQRLQIGWKYKIELSNAYQEHHHHLSCVTCGAVVVLAENIELESFLIQLVKPYDYTDLDHQLEIKGVCSTCQ